MSETTVLKCTWRCEECRCHGTVTYPNAIAAEVPQAIAADHGERTGCKGGPANIRIDIIRPPVDTARVLKEFTSRRAFRI